MARMSRPAPPSMVHRPASQSRAGEKTPRRAAWAVTANTRPESRARRLPLAESTSRRLAHPRARIMPTPNMAPPMSGPESDPRDASWRASSTASMSVMIRAWVTASAAEKVSSHTGRRSLKLPRANVMTAERRQKRERWAAAPNTMPMNRAPSATMLDSPRASMMYSRAMPPPLDANPERRFRRSNPSPNTYIQ
ncbi:hypothetical protein BMS3Bbin10_01488 [bacterium BMS3Bbin10]|nr:hypothetical protein BMS3Bbin10_01488 [bacterium BMS3Bbin10]